MRRFIQHVLPTGFMKVRYYGFLNPNCSVPLEQIAAKTELSYGFDIETPEKERTTKASLSCPHCGGKLIYQYSVLPYLLRSIPGVGQILALVILYEVHNVKRFARVQDFSSYARLIRPVKTSDGK